MIPEEVLDIIYYYTDISTCIKMNRMYALRKLIDNSEITMDYASENGHLEAVKYLHSIGKECTKRAMVTASVKGHSEVVKYLNSIELY